jgi:hypothetical protein
MNAVGAELGVGVRREYIGVRDVGMVKHAFKNNHDRTMPAMIPEGLGADHWRHNQDLK